MLLAWEAARYIRPLKSGRTSPLVLSCHRTVQDDAGTSRLIRQDFVVKARGLPEITDQSLFRELFGNLIAQEMGVITPTPALVELTPEFVQVANQQLARDPDLAPRNVRLSPGTAVGTEHLGGGLSPIGSVALLTEAQRKQAVQIYSYDLLVQNPDRTAKGKPNCATLGDQLIAFDFELCFSFLLVFTIGRQAQPWEVSKHGLGSEHLFHRVLRGEQIDWEPIRTALGRLSDGQLARLCGMLPAPWQETVQRVCTHLSAVRDHLPEFLIELQRSLG